MVDHVNSYLLKPVSVDVIFVCPFLDNAGNICFCNVGMAAMNG